MGSASLCWSWSPLPTASPGQAGASELLGEALFQGWGAASLPRAQLSAAELTPRHLPLSSRPLPCPVATSFQVTPGHRCSGLSPQMYLLVPSDPQHQAQCWPQWMLKKDHSFHFYPPLTSCNSTEPGTRLLLHKRLLSE